MRIESKNAKLLNVKGVILRLQGKLAEAIETHEKAAEYDPNYYANWVSLANTYALYHALDNAE